MFIVKKKTNDVCENIARFDTEDKALNLLRTEAQWYDINSDLIGCEDCAYSWKSFNIDENTTMFIDETWEVSTWNDSLVNEYYDTKISDRNKILSKIFNFLKDNQVIFDFVNSCGSEILDSFENVVVTDVFEDSIFFKTPYEKNITMKFSDIHVNPFEEYNGFLYMRYNY